MEKRESKIVFDRLEPAQQDQEAADQMRLLTDEQIEAGGLRPVRAWVRTHASADALRQKRQRNRDQEEKGWKQCNVKAREEDHDLLRGIAQASREGDVVDVLRELLEQLSPGSVRKPDPVESKLLMLVRTPSFRGRLIRWLSR